MISFESVSALCARIGQEFAVSPWLSIEQEQVNAFAKLTGDEQWIHTDPQRAARESIYGGTIVHGFLLLSMLTRLTIASFEIRDFTGIAVNCGFDQVRFLRPVPVGSKIRARYEVESSAEVKGGVEVVFAVSIFREDLPRPVCALSWRVRYLEPEVHKEVAS